MMKKIESVADIEEFAGKVVVAEIRWNKYRGGVMRIHEQPDWFQGGGYGYPVTCAVDENGVHRRLSITTHDLEHGEVHVRLATQDEITNAVPSYGEDWASV